MRKGVLGVLLLTLLLRPGPAAAQTGPVETAAAFIGRLQEMLRARAFADYVAVFRSELRAAEKSRIGVLFGDMEMTGVTLRPAGVSSGPSGPTRVFVQAFFENERSAVMESWTLALENRDGAWSVAGLDVSGSTTRLYKVLVPGEREVRAGLVEITHADVRFTFKDAAVFYDNLPGIETALVVVGRGRVAFTPSDANERHQLQILYRKDRIEDDIESLFIRCSSDFFASNVAVQPDPAGRAVSAAERGQAAAVFNRGYPRSFTIETSHDGQRLSYLPHGDETSMEFQSRRAGEMVYIYSPFAGEEVSLYDRARQRIVCLYSPQGTDEPPLKRMALSFEERYDITDYALDLRLSPATFDLAGRARVEVLSRVNALDSLKLRFSPAFEIVGIADAEGRDLFYTVDRLRGLLYVYLAVPPAAGGRTTFEVSYRGRMRPVPPTTDAIVQAGLDERLRFRPRYDTFFYSQAGAWYPAPPDEDYFQARLTVRVPASYQCVATGDLESRRREASEEAPDRPGDAVYSFVSRAPVKYLSFIVGKFDQRTFPGGPVPIEVSVSSEVMDSRPSLAGQAARILEFYSRAFGPYPYDKLGLVLRLWPVLGGHSPASFIVINDVPWLGEFGFPRRPDNPVDLSAWDGYFLAHEIAHQWWGHGVSVDTYKDQWLSEGLAQYAAASYLRQTLGPAGFAAVLRKFARWAEKKSARGPILMGSRLSYFDFTAYQAVVYDKAALVLFMLEDLIGRDKFEAGLRAFFEAHRFRPARTGEFRAAMEAVSGRGLEDFFQGWFSSWELPDVRTAWTATAVEGGARLDIRVTQIKGRFIFPLWVEWTRGQDKGRELIVVDEASETASLVLPVRPTQVRINPDKAVPGRFSSN
ncbi:MAG TPA: M1 family aminopeptidase [Candidatus Aminicenantes bacterium]|nr:M1 family aminopeptidase [Candidatus Aminicenantes bacterium]HRY64710.1 M1 family aminopeptidase [Candidatus Aminicenantes bacterium]HRZ71623.1 M1 family aminopeptidase [Candidatus Aminicenantes bacterium]